jgi:hypothetical protein
VVSDGEGNPVLAEVWTEAEEEETGVDEGVVVAELGLEVCGIAEDILVILRLM